MSRPEFITPMQAAFMQAAIASDREYKPRPIVKRVYRVLDKARPVPQRESVKVSYRTAQQLKKEGVL